ncbi:MAG: FtsQ-type POTRA domain-containing protein [Candidatus Nealsonbacteria bacterium]
MKKYYRKPHRYKKRKSLWGKKSSALVFLSLVVVGAAFYGLFIWQALWVEKITISGEQKIAEEEIDFLVKKNLENTILFFKTKSILKVDVGQIKEDILNAFPQIVSAEVKRSFFDAINVQITERTASALWCENENCFLLDNRGVIFEEALPDSKLIVVDAVQPPGELFLGKTVIAEDKITQILAIQNKLAETAKISIKKAVLVSNERLDVKTMDDWMIYFNLKGNLDWQVKELKLTLEEQISPEKRQELEYIDLRFSRVYYK